MAKFVDPKETLARVKAEAALKATLDSKKLNLPEFIRSVRNRRVLLLMKNGQLIETTVLLSTNELIAVRHDGDTSASRMDMCDIADVQLI